MPALGVIGEIYLVAAAIGSLYMVACVFMGQLHGHGDVGAGGHGHLHGHGDIGAGGHGHGAPDSAHGDAEANVPGHAGGHHLHNEAHLDVYKTAGHHALDPHGGGDHSGAVQVVEKRSFNLGRFLLTILSPMTIAIFLTFFGAVGLILTGVAPMLGVFSLLLSSIASIAITTQFLRLLRWMVFKMDVSSHVRIQDIIGVQGEVIVSITEGHKGEVTYVAGPGRQSAAALPAKPGNNFARGDRVMITDVRDGVVYVEPWSDFLLDNESEKVFRKQEGVDKG